MVEAGELGEIRQVNVEYVQGQLSSYVEPDAPERFKWRLDPERGGPSAVLGDIGTHAHHLLTFITGAQVAKVSADVGATVPGRQNDDYAGMLLRMDNGARGTFWVTQAASGSENALRIKVFGPSSTVQFAKSFCFNGLPCTKESLSLHSAGRAG